uniref:Uncharacterized protein n=1 Tax=Timema cristinae TaxID=61476 RepID=A0A7R9CEU5_TIMCR|nr:unnamed protein product [Timema cristinae]
MLPTFAFVPTEEVVGTFDSLCNSNVFPQEAQPIMDYFEDVWGLPKTNNNTEGGHRGFQQHISAIHPSIWKFVSAIKMEQSLNEVQIDQNISGQEPRQRNKYRNSMERLSQIVAGWAQHENCSLNDNCLCQRIEEDEHMPYERDEAHRIAKGQAFDEHSTKENLEIEAFSSADHDDLRNIDPEDMDYVSPDLEKSVDICLTPDRRSISSQSEVSVACLQDRILQMEETHYSTNEELQATLQELADLQTQLTDQTENERLAEEKQLEDSRSKADTLQDLLLNEDNVPDSCTEREQKLVDLLKSAQAERDSLLLKQEEMSSQLIELRQTNDMKEEELVMLKKRVFLLESTVDKTHQERSSLDQELALAKEESSSRHIEISHLSTLLENARCKIVDLEQAHKIDKKSEIDNLISVLRSERDVLESQVASLQEQLKRNQCENTKIREQLTQLQDDFKLTRNNAKSTVGDLSHQCEFFKQENNRLAAEIQLLEDSLNKLKMQNQNHLKDKEQLQTVLLEAQKHLGETERKLTEKEHALNEERRFHKEEKGQCMMPVCPRHLDSAYAEIPQNSEIAELFGVHHEEVIELGSETAESGNVHGLNQGPNADWIQFQTDLLTTVRVANDFKTEVQQELERINTENKFLKLRVNELESEVDKLKARLAAVLYILVGRPLLLVRINFGLPGPRSASMSDSVPVAP